MAPHALAVLMAAVVLARPEERGRNAAALPCRDLPRRPVRVLQAAVRSTVHTAAASAAHVRAVAARLALDLVVVDSVASAPQAALPARAAASEEVAATDSAVVSDLVAAAMTIASVAPIGLAQASDLTAPVSHQVADRAPRRDQPGVGSCRDPAQAAQGSATFGKLSVAEQSTPEATEDRSAAKAATSTRAHTAVLP
jgi:hypothetical protein